MGSTVTFMGNYDIYGRCDIYGAYTSVTSSVKYAVRPSVVTTKKFTKLTDLPELAALADVAASLQTLAKTHLLTYEKGSISFQHVLDDTMRY